MIHRLENEKLSVSVNDHGAELCSIYDKEKNREILWQADPAFWKRQAPILFPNVGRHYGNEYRLHGKTYPSSQHGFARDMEFICAEETADTLVHVLKSTEKTLEIYPFAFTLKVTHALKNKELTIHWEVINDSVDTMYFTIGGHPAFNVPVLEGTQYSDYSLYFKNTESPVYKLIDIPSGTVHNDVLYTLELNDGRYPLDVHLFDKDALVFDDGQIQDVGILLPDGSPFLCMHAEGFPNFGIWAAPGAPFVCLEPWMGRCDNFGYNGTLPEKDNINVLSSGEHFEKEYSITVF